MNLMSYIGKLKSFVFAPLCLCCGRRSRNGNAICYPCLRIVVKSAILSSSGGNYLFEYNPITAALLRGLRWSAQNSVTILFYRILIRQGWIARWRTYDLLVVAPQNRPKEGGARLDGLAHLIAKETPLFYMPNVLEKKSGMRQHGKNLSERMDQPCFLRISSSMGESIVGKKVLLIDDVYTSGTTLEMSAYLLRKQGASEVICFSLVYKMVNRFERKHQ